MTRAIHPGLRSPDDLGALARIVGWAFGFGEADAAPWLERGGTENLRLCLDDGAVTGGLMHVPMGQFFGGRAVPMVGIAGVAVAPEARGRGVALSLMNATVRELWQRGVALSTLYPATLTLYRKSGYAPAGCLFDVSVPAKSIGVSERAGSVRPAQEADLPRIEELYTRVAQGRDGRLARGSYIWNRIKKPRATPARGFVVEQGGGIAGYLFASQQRTPSEHFDLSLSDVCAATPFAAKKLLSFLYDHRSIAEQIKWRGAQADALLLAIPERIYEVKLREHWMTRICNVQRALEARGYPAGVNLSLELEVVDDVIPENSGRLVLTVASGRGSVEPGGTGKLRLDVRALSALFTGFQSPAELALGGSLEGDASSLSIARTLFSGAAPEMPDFF